MGKGKYFDPSGQSGRVRKEEMRLLKQKIRERLMSGTFPSQMRLIHVLATSLDILMRDTENRLRRTAVECGVPAQTMRSDTIRGMENYTRAAKSAAYWLERYIDPMGQAEFDFGGVEAFDRIRTGANVMLKLIMMLSDRLTDEEAADGLMDYLNAQKSGGAFTQEDLDRFDNV